MKLKQRIQSRIARSIILQSLITYMNYKKLALRLWLAIKIADTKQAAFNRRYFVMPDYRHRLIILSKSEINTLKRRKVFNKRMTHMDVMDECFYYTPLSRNNEGKLSDREKAQKKLEYYNYYNQIMRRRTGK